jgi:hypothetical protein
MLLESSSQQTKQTKDQYQTKQVDFMDGLIN